MGEGGIKSKSITFNYGFGSKISERKFQVKPKDERAYCANYTLKPPNTENFNYQNKGQWWISSSINVRINKLSIAIGLGLNDFNNYHMMRERPTSLDVPFLLLVDISRDTILR